MAEVEARRRSLLVLTDVHFPGWKAWVDGRETEIERVDYLLRGVPVPAGAHRVELRYEPASWRAGSIVSVLAALGLLAAVWKSERRWPGRSTAPPRNALGAPLGRAQRRRPAGWGRAADRSRGIYPALGERPLPRLGHVRAA